MPQVQLSYRTNTIGSDERPMEVISSWYIVSTDLLVHDPREALEWFTERGEHYNWAVFFGTYWIEDPIIAVEFKLRFA